MIKFVLLIIVLWLYEGAFFFFFFFKYLHIEGFRSVISPTYSQLVQGHYVHV